MKLSILWLCGLSLACSKTSSEVAAPHEAVAPSPIEAEAPGEPASATAPPGTERLAARLGARHTADLPTEDELARYPDFAASLRWIATHDPRMIARARALGLLRFDDGPQTRALLLSILDAPAAHPSLRAAAIVGSGGLGLDAELRARLDRATQDPDPRVRAAAQARLSPRVEERAAPATGP